MVFFTPKNFKNGRFILLKYRWRDLLFAIIGVAVSTILVVGYVTIFSEYNIALILLMLLPAGTSLMLVMPFGIYHNVMEFFKMTLKSMNESKTYTWEGIYKYEKE